MASTSFKIRGGGSVRASDGAIPPSFTTTFMVRGGGSVIAGAPGPPSFSTTFKISAGGSVRAAAPGGLSFSTTFKISAGGACKARSSPWDDGSSAPKRKVPWLPGVQVKPVRPDGSWNPDVWRALNYLFNEVLGGINAPTIAEVTQTVTATQSQVLATQANAENAMNYAAGIAAAVTATAEVTQSAGLPGSGSIPTVPGKPGIVEP